MRNLKFSVEGDRLAKDPACDFSGIQSGCSGFLRCMFNFSAQWAGYRRIAVFSAGIQETAVEIQGGAATVPSEVLAGRRMQVKVIGVKPDARIITNKIYLRLEG